MSWQAYIDSQLVGTGHVDEAAIFDIAGTEDWAHSSNFKISPAELKVIVASFSSPDHVFANGFHVNGVKYTTIRSESDILVGKQAKTGFVVSKSDKALILGHHADNVDTKTCTSVVQGLAEYLKSVGY